MTCESLIPTNEGKAVAWKKAIDTTTYSAYQRSAIWAGFFTRKSYELTKEYYPLYLEKVREIADLGDKEFIEAFIHQMAPSFRVE